jgi:hypothetical protein
MPAGDTGTAALDVTGLRAGDGYRRAGFGGKCNCCSAIVVPGELLAGVYAAAVTAILIGAGMLFLFAFVYWYEATIGHEQPKS